MRTAATTLLLAVAGCFGAGPLPTAPSEAELVFSLPPQVGTDCGLQPYIGDVEFDGSIGYAAVGQYEANCNGGGGGGPQNTTMTTITRFGQPTMGVATLTTESSQVPRVTMPTAGALTFGAWVSKLPGAQTIAIDSSDASRAANFMPVNVNDGDEPVTLLSDADHFYVALDNRMDGRPDFANPTYPCCGASNNASTMGSIYRVTGQLAELVLNTPLQCFYTEHCLAQNADSLFYITTETPNTAVHMSAKTGTPADTSLGQASTGLAIAGVAANSQYAAWGLTRPFDQTGGIPQCQIAIYDLAATNLTFFTATGFDCAEVALDEGDDYAYFAIVDVPTSGGQNGNMAGRGLGRVKLSDPTVFESIDLGIDGLSAGARRVIPAGDNVFAIDPFAIAKIAKASFTDKHDFAP